MDSNLADNWVRFLREYAPIPRQSNMYAEEMLSRAEKMGIVPLAFEHPAPDLIARRFDPLGSGIMTNVILTGTAGEGKTQFLFDLWLTLGGSRNDLKKNPKFLECNLVSSKGPVRVVFIFDLSKCVPESGQEWQPTQIALIESLADALLNPQNVKFLVAANDGKLLQALRSIKPRNPNSCTAGVEPEIEDMLARRQDSSKLLDLYLLDLSSIPSAVLMDRARSNLLERPEWSCFRDCSSDPAYGESSPLTRNFKILSSDRFYGRLRALVELCDVNSMHISVRDLIALLVNGLLGHPAAVPDRVMTPENLREFAQDSVKASTGSVHRNILGENFPEHQREGSAVFEYLQYFRIGQETSNTIDDLLLFGKDLKTLMAKYCEVVEDPTGLDPINPAFENLRREYLEADEFDERKREAFMTELAAQRRRLFFRIPESDTADFDPWHLTVFQNSAAFLKGILYQLRNGKEVDSALIEKLVRGLNRIWSGMLFDDGSHLYLTSGLDFTSAKISRLSLYKVPVSENLHGEKIDIALNGRSQPEFRVYLLKAPPILFRLDLMRFEFILRVAEGALPNSFSRERYEDMINFKGILLRQLESASSGRKVRVLNYLSVDEMGRPHEEPIML